MTSPTDRDTGGTPVMVVAGLSQRVIDAVVEATSTTWTGWTLRYAVVMDGPDPVLSRTVTRPGAPEDSHPLGTSHGCIACAVRDDVLTWLSDLEAAAAVRVRVVLPVGADPACLVDPIDLTVVARSAGAERHNDEVDGMPDARIAGVVVAVDASTLVAQVASDDELVDTDIPHGSFGHRPVAEAALGMLQHADVVAVDGLGTSDDHDTCVVRELVAQAAPYAVAVRAALTSCLSDAIERVAHDPFRTEQAHESLATRSVTRPPAFGVATQLWSSRRPLHPWRLMDAMESLAEAVVSLDGPLWLATRPHEVLRLSIAGGAASISAVDAWMAEAPEHVWSELGAFRRARAGVLWDPYYGDREACLVSLTLGEDAPDRVRQILDTLPLDDGELARGLDAWTAGDDPFVPWLGEPWDCHPSAVVHPGPCDGVHDGTHDAPRVDPGAGERTGSGAEREQDGR